MNVSQEDNGVKLHTHCRICKSPNLVEFLNLGEQPLANAFLDQASLHKPELKYPLRVAVCASCGLCQLRDVVDPEVLFRDYIYFSSGMPSSDHFQNYAKEVVNRFISNKGDLVVEIGSNDGHLLRLIKDAGADVLGIDPALNIAEMANKRGIETIGDFFSTALACRIVKWRGVAQVIIANNVVAHIDDYYDLFEGIRLLLAEGGVFIFEAPYLADMFENLAFDTVYHEHLSYLALRPLVQFFPKFGMEIFHVEILPVQGNSIRVYVCRQGMQGIRFSLFEILQKEYRMKLNEVATYLAMAERIKKLKEEVRNLLLELKKQGKRIYGYGASAKGNTLLNYFGVGRETIECITEELPSKIGLYTPGTHIPVVDIREARKNLPDYYLLLAWNYKDAILKKESEFISSGGKFIMPVGNIRII